MIFLEQSILFVHKTLKVNHGSLVVRVTHTWCDDKEHSHGVRMKRILLQLSAGQKYKMLLNVALCGAALEIMGENVPL